MTTTADTSQYLSLWFETLKRPWSTLGLVAASDPLFLGEVGQELAFIGSTHLNKAVHHRPAEQVGLADVGRFSAEIQALTRLGERVLLTVGNPVQHREITPIVRTLDVAVVVALRGHTTLQEIKDTVELIGRERVLGSILLHTSLSNPR